MPNWGALGELAGLGAGGLLVNEAYNRLGAAGDYGMSEAPLIGEASKDFANFQPFGVTSNLGNVQTNQQGGFNVNLSPEQQALQQQLAGGSQGLFAQSLMPTASREQSVYDRIRAVQQPGEKRQRLALENRLAGQGRQGLRTAAYGGSPEQFALAQAQAEAQNQAALMALQQAQSEQAQQASIGTQYMNNQYLPQAQMLNMLGAGTQVASLADMGRRQAAGLFADASMSGLELGLASRMGQAELMGTLGSGLLDGAGKTLGSALEGLF
jgi:hypothetical protein